MGSSFATIEDINHDVALEILNIIDTTEDLDAATRASPTLHRVFRAFRRKILRKILRRELHDDTIHYAMTIIRLHTHAELTVTEEDPPISTIVEYVRRHAHTNESSGMTLPAELQELQELANLNTTVSRLARRFYRGIQGVIQSKNPDQLEVFEEQFTNDEALPCDITDIEMARVKRAFLRLELYFRCFKYGENEAEEVFHQLDVWEVEQSASVFHYLKSKLDYIIMLMQDDFVQDVASCVAQENEPPVNGRKRKRNADDLVMDQNCTVCYSELDGLLLFAQPEMVRAEPVEAFDPLEYCCFLKPRFRDDDLLGQTIGSLMHRGLPYIEHLFQLSPQECKERIRQDARPRPWYMMLDYHMACPRQMEHMRNGIWDEELDRPNWGSEWFYNYRVNRARSWMRVGQWATRRLGLELWDYTGVLMVYYWTRSRNLGHLEHIDREFGMPTTSISAEEVLNGLTLTRRVLEQVRKRHAFHDAELRVERYRRLRHRTD